MNNPAKMIESEGPKIKKTETKEAQAERSVYKLATGQLYLPALQFRQSVIYASRGKKQGKRSAASMLSAALFVAADKFPLTDVKGEPIKTYTIDSRTGVIPSTGGRIFIHRPMIEHWACWVGFNLDLEIFSEKVIADLLQEAGIISGVGDYRPSCGGWFGRFKLVDK